MTAHCALKALSKGGVGVGGTGGQGSTLSNCSKNLNSNSSSFNSLPPLIEGKKQTINSHPSNCLALLTSSSSTRDTDIPTPPYTECTKESGDPGDVTPSAQGSGMPTESEIIRESSISQGLESITLSWAHSSACLHQKGIWQGPEEMHTGFRTVTSGLRPPTHPLLIV